MESSQIYTKDDLLQIWERIGKSNSWIREAGDPPFDKGMLEECHTLLVLEEQLKYHNWCLGQGFYYQSLCFINQREAGDEWLTIRNDLPFESYTFKRIIQAGKFQQLISRFLAATDAQLRDLDY